MSQIKQTKLLSWRVMGIQDSDDNGTNESLLIKMASSTSQKLTLFGAPAYNEMVQI